MLAVHYYFNVFIQKIRPEIGQCPRCKVGGSVVLVEDGRTLQTSDDSLAVSALTGHVAIVGYGALARISVCITTVMSA